MENVFIQILNMGIAAGWLILAVMLLRIIFKNMPKGMRCILWGLAGIRLVCPCTIESALSLIPSAQTIRPDIVYQQKPEIHSGIGALNRTVNPLLSESFAPDVTASINPLQIWIFLASFIWIAGMVLMAVYAVSSYCVLYQKVRESVRWKDNLYFCDHIHTPFILGVARPRIYLPSGIEEEHIVYVHAHENAHLARRDHIWKLIAFLLLSVYWFHPLCWAAYWLFCKELEFACDERAVRDFDMERKKAYAKALLECSIDSRKLAACPLAFGEISVKKRIQGVLGYRRPAFWKIIIAAIVCVMAAACFLTNPKGSASELFGREYAVEEIVYESPLLSVMLTPGESPSYSLTKNGTLMEKRSALLYGEEASKEWVTCGRAEKITLTEDNLDQYIYWNGPLLPSNFKPSELREKNDGAWYVNSEAEEGKFYYILQQKNGGIYLAEGSDRGEDTQMQMDPCNFWRIYKLKEKA